MKTFLNNLAIVHIINFLLMEEDELITPLGHEYLNKKKNNEIH